MLEPQSHRLSLSQQCRLLGISRSSVYYKPSSVKTGDLELMRLIDEQYLKTPFYGSRSMTQHLKRQG
jgi:putative transposase